MEKLRRMLDRDPDAADMDTSDPSTCPDGYAPLHYAARSGALACVKLLVERGADINRLTRAGRASALMRASYMGDLDMVLYLLENGADPTLQVRSQFKFNFNASRVNRLSIVLLKFKLYNFDVTVRRTVETLFRFRIQTGRRHCSRPLLGVMGTWPRPSDELPRRLSR